MRRFWARCRLSFPKVDGLSSGEWMAVATMTLIAAIVVVLHSIDSQHTITRVAIGGKGTRSDPGSVTLASKSVGSEGREIVLNHAMEQSSAWTIAVYVATGLVAAGLAAYAGRRFGQRWSQRATFRKLWHSADGDWLSESLAKLASAPAPSLRSPVVPSSIPDHRPGDSMQIDASAELAAWGCGLKANSPRPDSGSA